MEPNEPMQEPVGAPHIKIKLPEQQERRQGLAIASMILGLIGIFGFCCCGFNLICALLALIFGIVVLAGKRDGTGFAVTGIVAGSLTLILAFAVLYSFRGLYPYSDTIARDYQQLYEEQDEVFAQYEQDGTLPDYLMKYTEPPFSDFFAKYNGTFYDVMDALLQEHKAGTLPKMNYTLPPESSVPEEVPAAEPAL